MRFLANFITLSVLKGIWNLSHLLKFGPPTSNCRLHSAIMLLQLLQHALTNVTKTNGPTIHQLYGIFNSNCFGKNLAYCQYKKISSGGSSPWEFFLPSVMFLPNPILSNVILKNVMSHLNQGNDQIRMAQALFTGYSDCLLRMSLMTIRSS